MSLPVTSPVILYKHLPFLHLQPHVATPSSQTMVPKACLGQDSSDRSSVSILASDLHPGAHWLWRQPRAADADGEFTLFTSTFPWLTLTFVDFGVTSLLKGSMRNQCLIINAFNETSDNAFFKRNISWAGQTGCGKILKTSLLWSLQSEWCSFVAITWELSHENGLNA